MKDSATGEDIQGPRTLASGCSARPSPIYLTTEESKRDFDEIVETIRWDLTRLRGKLHDVQRMWPGWRERVDMADGGITCVIMALHDGVEEYKRVHKKS